MPRLVIALGETDCEALGDGLLRQPANAISSLSFSVFGGLLLLAAGRSEARERRFRTVMGWLLIATGLGSFLYHGPQSTGSHFVHDVTFLCTIWVLAVMNGVGVSRRQERAGWIVAALGTVLAAAFLAVFPDWTNVLTTVAVGALVLADLAGHRSGRRAGRWYAASLLLLGAALAANILGRTGNPGCFADSLLQLHGLWHALAAAGITAYVLATTSLRSEQPVPEGASR